MLAVDQFLAPVCQTHELAGVVGILPRPVNFQFHAIITLTLAVKKGRGLVGILVNFLVLLGLAVAVPAQRVILVIVLIVGVVVQDGPAAASTVDVESIIAGMAQQGAAVPGVVIVPDAPPTAGADHGLNSETVGTEQLTVKFGQLVKRVGFTAYATDFRFFHWELPP